LRLRWSFSCGLTQIEKKNIPRWLMCTHVHAQCTAHWQLAIRPEPREPKVSFPGSFEAWAWPSAWSAHSAGGVLPHLPVWWGEHPVHCIAEGSFPSPSPPFPAAI
jgi:hypothetical protein